MLSNKMAKFKVTIETPTRHKEALPKKKPTYRTSRMEADEGGELWLPMANYFKNAEDLLEPKTRKKKSGKSSYDVQMWGEDWSDAVPKDTERVETISEETDKEIARIPSIREETEKEFEQAGRRTYARADLKGAFEGIPEDEETKGIKTYSQEYGLEKGTGKEDKGVDVIGFVGKQLEKVSEEARKETYGFMLKDIAEKGAFYKPKYFAGKIAYNNLKKQGFADEDEYGRPYVTDKGKDLLKKWKIPYKEKSREPKFEEKKDEEVEKIVTEAEKEDKFGVTPRKPSEFTAQELVETA